MVAQRYKKFVNGKIEEAKPTLIKLIDYLVTYPPDPLPLVKGRGVLERGASAPLKHPQGRVKEKTSAKEEAVQSLVS